MQPRDHRLAASRIVTASARALDAVTIAGGWVGVLGLAAIVVIFCYEVVSRYVFDTPTRWASDFVSYVLCASIFLCMPEVTRANGHVAVTVLIDRLGDRRRRVAQIAAYSVAFAVCLFAAYLSGLENLRQFSRDITTLTVIPVPKWSISVFITYGLAVSSLQFLLLATSRRRP